MPLNNFSLKGQVALPRHVNAPSRRDATPKVVQNSRAEAKGDMRMIFDVACCLRDKHVGRLCRPCALKKHKNSQTTTWSQLHLSKHPPRATSRLRPCNSMPSVSVSSSYALAEFLRRARLARKQNKKSSLETVGESGRAGVWNFNCERFFGEATAFRFFLFRREGEDVLDVFYCPRGEPAMCL